MSKKKHPLRLFRERHVPPLSQTDLAQMFGVSRPTINRWESRARRPDAERCSIIIETTGIPLAELRPDLAKLVKIAA